VRHSHLSEAHCLLTQHATFFEHRDQAAISAAANSVLQDAAPSAVQNWMNNAHLFVTDQSAVLAVTRDMTAPAVLQTVASMLRMHSANLSLVLDVVSDRTRRGHESLDGFLGVFVGVDLSGVTHTDFQLVHDIVAAQAAALQAAEQAQALVAAQQTAAAQQAA
jgi:hypothetical protein